MSEGTSSLLLSEGDDASLFSRRRQGESDGGGMLSLLSG